MRPVRTLFLVLAVLALSAGRAHARFVDANANEIDDRIERVHAVGWNAAFVDDDPAKKMVIGVSNPAAVLFDVYVKFDHQPTAADQVAMLATGVPTAWPFTYVPYVQSRATWTQVVALAALPGAIRVEAIPVMYATNHYATRVLRARDARGLTEAENYALFPNAQQHLGLDGSGIVIAILDTGVNDEVDQVNAAYPGHESLKGKFLGGGEFWCGQSLCTTANNASSNPQDHGAEASHYHGTHVAGTAMGTGGPGGFFAGVAPAARLVDCKVLSDAGASVGGSERGLEWVLANRRTLWAGLPAGSPYQGIDVVSMSLGSTECTGGSGTSDGLGETLVNTVVDSGLVVCIATGNDGSTECIASPSSADKVISVGASQHNRTLDRGDDLVTSFSNEGPRDDDGDLDHFDEMKPSVVAPGAGIISAFGDPTTDGTAYQQLSGTSMSTPCVSGCAALVLQANPSLTPAQVKSILQNTAEHDVPTIKASGDRGQDPFGLDANYDPGSGWGLVDVFAAGKEAVNSTSGVQVVQVKATALPANGRIDFEWTTQREWPFLGFNVWRAVDVNGAPGAFTKLNTLPVTPTGHSGIQGQPNRTRYTWADATGLVAGQRYWYRVDWIDLLSAAHQEPAVPVAFGTLARIATAYYRIAHNAPDNDLLIRVGSDPDYDPGSLGGAPFEVLGPGEVQQDSAVVIMPAAVPANTGTSTLGTIEHYWSIGFRQGDGAEPYLPPSLAHPWFLRVTDGGYVNRTGRVTAFSLFVNTSPGSASGTTYATNHTPMPQPTFEGGVVPVTLWIPEQAVTPARIATLDAEPAEGGNLLTLVLAHVETGLSAMVYRSTTDEFATRQPLFETARPVDGLTFRYLDATAAPGMAYSYWIELRGQDGSSVMNGPVTVGVSAASVVFAARPNPFAAKTTLAYALGSDVAKGGSALVTISVFDARGRMVRTIARQVESVGPHEATWNGTDDRGVALAAGVYHVTFRANDTLLKRQKVALLR